MKMAGGGDRFRDRDGKAYESDEADGRGSQNSAYKQQTVPPRQSRTTRTTITPKPVLGLSCSLPCRATVSLITRGLLPTTTDVAAEVVAITPNRAWYMSSTQHFS